jgi:CBS-domain-containing membrane protein
MSAPVETAMAGDSLARAARLMTELGVRSLPVVDRNRSLVGIVSRADVLSTFLRTDEEIRADILGEVLVHLCSGRTRPGSTSASTTGSSR